MSRNFELLQNLGKEQVLLDVTAPAVTASAPKVAELPPAVEPQLKLEPTEQEQLTKLVQRVFLLPGTEASRVVVFMASESGNGSSWICARVAETLAAQVSGTVCLVDANFHNPGLHREFGVENREGFADAMLGPIPIHSFAQSLARPNLRLVSCGSAHETSLPVLGADRVRQKLQQLREEADYILIDAAAVNVSGDAAMLGAAADGVVVVLKANSSRRETARRTLEDLQESNVRILGAVLNQRTFPIPEFIYNRL